MATLYKYGSRGEGVKIIQRALAHSGLPVLVDGIYGIVTQEAVVEFQRRHNLVSDGIVGPATIALLIPNMTASALHLKKSKRKITDIIIHCSATPEGRAYTVDQMRRDHKKQGWSDIGYHYVVYRNGHVESGRDVDLIGAHCEGHNAHSIGVCYVGGMDKDNKVPKDTRTLAQKAGLLKILEELKALYPDAKIVSHRDYDTHGKKCPSFDATHEYENIGNS